MSAPDRDYGLIWVEQQLRAQGRQLRVQADPARCAPPSLVTRRYNLAHFYFRRLFPGLPRQSYDRLEDLAVSYMLDPSRYA